jgi:hypothetical protein
MSVLASFAARGSSLAKDQTSARDHGGGRVLRRAGSPCSRSSVKSEARGVCDPLAGGLGGLYDFSIHSSLFISFYLLLLVLHDLINMIQSYFHICFTMLLGTSAGGYFDL